MPRCGHETYLSRTPMADAMEYVDAGLRVRNSLIARSLSGSPFADEGDEILFRYAKLAAELVDAQIAKLDPAPDRPDRDLERSGDVSENKQAGQWRGAHACPPLMRARRLSPVTNVRPPALSS